MIDVFAIIDVDEGSSSRGLWVDYLANLRHDACVTLVEGDLNETFTVEEPQAPFRKVEVSHVGAGVLTGVPTYIGGSFSLAPLQLKHELITLAKEGINPVIYVDDQVQVITPYDTLIEELLSTRVGLPPSSGSSEARYRAEKFPITVADIFNGSIEEKLNTAREGWYGQRLEELDLHPVDDAEKLKFKLFNHQPLWNAFLRARDTMLTELKVISPLELTEQFGAAIVPGWGNLLTNPMGGIRGLASFLHQLGDIKLTAYYLAEAVTHLPEPYAEAVIADLDTWKPLPVKVRHVLSNMDRLDEDDFESFHYTIVGPTREDVKDG